MTESGKTRATEFACDGGTTPRAVLDLVKANSAGHRADRPITARTAPGAGGEAEILGWLRGPQVHLSRLDEVIALHLADAAPAGPVDTRALLDLFARDYLVLRCPWGWYAGVTGALRGLVPLRDPDRRRAADLAPDEADDDLFALDIDAFHEQFTGIRVGAAARS